ncbi:MAG: DUF3291 domain-containing protein [Pseudomonadota bacterium]
MHLAQLNIGRLVAPPGAPEVAAFMAALDRVNAIGKRSPGFVWMMEGSGEPGTGNTQNCLGGDPRMVANLTVWTGIEALETFVWQTVHRQFYARRAAWFQAMGEPHFVMWWVAEGHRPDLAEAMDRLAYLRAHGDSDRAFGWAHLPKARHWRQAACGETADEGAMAG